MDKDSMLRSGAVFGASYIKRWLEGRYDQLMDLPAVAKLKTLSAGPKLAIEAILYTLTAYAEQKLSDQSPLGLMAKTVLMDAAPEIASRLMKDARADLTVMSSASPGAGGAQQSVASKLLALENGALLCILTSMEEMDDATRSKFLSFAASASQEELAKFGALPQEQRKTLLSTHGIGQGQSLGSWAASFKAFASDFWVVFKAWSQKSKDVSLRVLDRYMLALLWVLKTSAVLWAMALVACTASAVAGRWPLFVMLIGLVVASGAGVVGGRRLQRSWLAVAGMVSTAVMALLAMLAAAGYPDSIFGVAVLFLVGMPTLAIVTMLIPVTMVFEILRSLFPEGHKTLVRAFQMLLAVFFGILIFAVVLLVFPPQNPTAFLFVVPMVIAVALGVGFGLVRVNPEIFLRTNVVIAMAVVLLVAMGMMSMPNLRHKLRTLPKKFDGAWVAKPTPVAFASSKEIEFVTVDGDVMIWYAEREGGGYDLYRCEGRGPYYAPDGRGLKKADNDAVRKSIGIWVDQQEERRVKVQQENDRELAAQALAQQAEEQKRQAEESARAERAQRDLEAATLARQAEEQKQQAEGRARAEQARRESYLVAKTLPNRVEYIVCAETAAHEPLNDFSMALANTLQGGGKKASNIVFAPAFVSEGGFELFYSGKGGADIQSMPLSKMGNKLLLVRCDEVSAKASATVPGLFNSTVKMSFRVLDAADGKIVDEFQFSGVGPGTSEADAKSAGFERILEQVGKRGM